MVHVMSEVDAYLSKCYVSTNPDDGEESIKQVKLEGNYRTLIYRSEIDASPLGDEMWSRLTMGLVRK